MQQLILGIGNHMVGDTALLAPGYRDSSIHIEIDAGWDKTLALFHLLDFYCTCTKIIGHLFKTL
jgi:hypothetical protein